MQKTKSTIIAERMEANFIHGCWLGSNINGTALTEDTFTTYYTSPYTVPWMNVVLRADGTVPDLELRVKSMLDKFDRPMTWRLGPLSTNVDTIRKVLECEGLVQGNWIEPAMCLNVEKFKPSEPLNELRIEEVHSNQQVEDWLVPFAEGFSVPPDVVGHFRSYGLERLVTNPGEKWFVGYCQDRPASCAQYIIAEGINMIYSICTTSEFRSRGFARRMVEHAAVDSLSYSDLPVCLYSSAMGLSLYESIGFETQCARTDYIYHPSKG